MFSYECIFLASFTEAVFVLQPVAVFLVQNEDSQSIAAALKIFRDWNSTFFSNDPCFVIDHSLAELNAILHLWPGMMNELLVLWVLKKFWDKFNQIQNKN